MNYQGTNNQANKKWPLDAESDAKGNNFTGNLDPQVGTVSRLGTCVQWTRIAASLWGTNAWMGPTLVDYHLSFLIKMKEKHDIVAQTGFNIFDPETFAQGLVVERNEQFLT